MHIQRLQELIDEPGKTLLSDRDGLSNWVKKVSVCGCVFYVVGEIERCGRAH